MSDRAMSVSEAALHLKPFISKPALYKWIEKGEVASERSPIGGAIVIRESEVVRILAWYEGVDPDTAQKSIDALRGASNESP